MPIVIAIILSIPLCSILYAFWADRILKNRPRLRWLVRGFVALVLILYVSVIFTRYTHHLPRPLSALLYIWAIVVLPLTTIFVVAEQSLRLIVSLSRRRLKNKPNHPVDPLPENSAAPSRRQFLAASAALIPPIATFGFAGFGLSQYGQIRIRSFTLPIPNLPSNLAGLTLAHVSDLHIGNFVDSRVINRVVDLTNSLRPDLICFTGDLIDSAISDLPAGLDMFRRLDPKYALALCEGNHDLFESPYEFRTLIRNAGFHLLINESLTLTVRGEQIQLLGASWGPSHVPRDSQIPLHAAATLGLLQPNAFPILLAHHPHLFDYAIDKQVPLTLAGHTHGGQIMLTPNLGPGPLMYKYFSGLYQRKASNLVVSNGVGNWFPLRANAPAEIIHITLQKS